MYGTQDLSVKYKAINQTQKSLNYTQRWWLVKVGILKQKQTKQNNDLEKLKDSLMLPTECLLFNIFMDFPLKTKNGFCSCLAPLKSGLGLREH